ncbi:MAG TPA: class I SAM-dependent methyltransferase [Phycicoccus sp.]|nr:class I SAM-dependent methyltransferase [Phycicoccus sp.]
MDAAVVRRLASPEGQSLLRSLPPYAEDEVFALQSRLRSAGHDSELVAAALSQSRLRARARAKFGDFADDLFFTADGLEQATRIEVATTHAHRFASLSLATVHDLGCGIGADAVTMSVLGITVQAIDADPVTAAVADVNLRPWPDSRARVGLAEDFVAPVDAMRDRTGVWLDPARRTPGVADIRGRTRRTYRLDDISPSWATVLEIAERVPAAGVKLSPAFAHELVPAGAEAQWTSWEGSVVECAIWFGPLARRSGRSARILRSDRDPVEIDESMVVDEARVATSLSDVGPWLHEPDRAVTTAGLIGVVTGPLAGLEVETGLGYVLTDSELTLPFTRRYAVREAMPFNIKSLRGWLRERGVTGLTIKKRGIRLDDAGLRRQLHIGTKAGDGAQATVILTRIGGQQVTLVVDPA